MSFIFTDFSILQYLSKHVGAVFGEHGLSIDLGEVRVSDRPDLADFQCNGAMAAARFAKCAPRELAEKIAVDVALIHGVHAVNVAGPGFINFRLTNEFLCQYLNKTVQDDRLLIPKFRQGMMVLDYGGPNIAKPMHVGHLRTAVIGDSLRRIATFAGHETLGDTHLGDWGTQFGMVISEMQLRFPTLPYFDPDYTGDYPTTPPVTLEALEEIYPTASNHCKNDPLRMEQARQATVELQDGRRGYRALWQHMVDLSLVAIRQNYQDLCVEFDLWKGESDVHPRIAPMVDRLRAQNLAVDDNGAVIMHIAQDDDKKEIPPLILYKRDGAVMYGTTDLATIEERVELYNPTAIVYVVDQRQNLHFEQVFRAAVKSGMVDDQDSLYFAGFGTVNGVDGKPFKTRAGGVMKLEEFIDLIREKALQRMNELSLGQDFTQDEKTKIADHIMVAAIRFADLQNPRMSDYIFDVERLSQFEGKTGPYLLYQAVRIASLLAKVDDDLTALDIRIQNLNEDERSLAILMTELPSAIQSSLNALAPHVLCDYIFRLAQAFGRFYNNCPVLSENNADIRTSRIALCQLTYRHFALVLSLLGMQIPDRM
jgi:arginyl-tRNA synthetase